MDNIRILIGDSDQSYVEALVRFLLGSGKGYGITYYTDPDAFDKDKKAYDVGLLTEPYIRMLEGRDAERIHVRHIIQLCGSMDSGYRVYETIYKFQSMQTFLEKIDGIEMREPHKASRFAVKTEFTGIYSPMRHELELPFSLLYSQIMSEKGKTLFIDLEENSILNQMIHKTPECSLLDVIYEMEQQKKNFRLELCTETFNGFAYIGPVSNPSELVNIVESQWLKLLDACRAAHYNHVVMLFGTLPQGFLNMIKEIDQMLLLGKPGNYYQAGAIQFASSVKKMNPDISIQEVLLPLSAGSANNDYRFEEMMEGNLGVYMRKSFAGGQRNVAAGR